jgi:hypothetical protein
MEQAALVDALGKHLDALATSVNWAVGLAILTVWTGAQRSKEVSLFGLKTKRKDAFYLLGAAFLYVNIASIVLFLRIANILETIDTKNLARALTILGTNAWPFNPYAYYGNSYSSMVVSNFGFGALIVIWWIGYTALAMCRDDRKSLDYLAVVGAFLFIGLLSMGAIQYGFAIVLDRAGELDPVLRSSILSQAFPRLILTFVGIGLGGLIFRIAISVQTRNLAKIKEGSVTSP